MKFKISRTSLWGDSQPHEKAFSGTVVRVDHRNFKTPEEHDKKSKPSWLSQGTNHRLIDGTIARDLGTEVVWFIEINTLEELLAFQKECGTELVIGDDWLEIYDDYRE